MDQETMERVVRKSAVVTGDTAMPTRASVNAMLRRVDIKGKDYIDVAQRINGFWELFPEGSIVTKWLVLDGERCVCQATVSNMGVTLATGTAEERKGSSNINKTSYIENCETSAVGRALGLAGIGSTDSVASADEVRAAVDQQRARPEYKGSYKDRQASDAAAAKNRCWRAVKDFCAVDGIDPKEEFGSLKGCEGFDDSNPAFWTLWATKYEFLAAEAKGKHAASEE